MTDFNRVVHFSSKFSLNLNSIIQINIDDSYFRVLLI